MLKAVLTWLNELSGRGELPAPLPDSLTSIMHALDISISSPSSLPFSAPATASASAQSSPRTVPEEQGAHQFTDQVSGGQKTVLDQETSRDALSVDDTSLISQEHPKIKEEEHIVACGTGTTATIDRVKVINSLPIAMSLGNMAGTQGVVHQGVLADVQGENPALAHPSLPILPSSTAQGASLVPELDMLAGPSGDLHDPLLNQSINNTAKLMKDSSGNMQPCPQPVSMGHAANRSIPVQSAVPSSSPTKEPISSRPTVPGQSLSRGKKTHAMEEFGRDVVMQFLQGKQKVAVGDPSGTKSITQPEATTPGGDVTSERETALKRIMPEVKDEYDDTNCSILPQIVDHMDVLAAHGGVDASIPEESSVMHSLNLPAANGKAVKEVSCGSCAKDTQELRRDPTLGTWADEGSTGVKRTAEGTVPLCAQDAKRLKPTINGDSAEVDFVVPNSNICDLDEMAIFERSSMGDGDQISDQFKNSEGFERVHVVDKPRTAYAGVVMGGGEDHGGRALPPG